MRICRSIISRTMLCAGLIWGCMNAADALQLGDVGVGNDAAAEHHDVACPALLEQLEHPRELGHVGARQDRQPDRVGVLLDHGLDDLLGRLVQARVDDLEAGVAQGAGDHLRPAVVSVEPRFGHHDAIGPLHRAPSVGRGPVRGARRGRGGRALGRGAGTCPGRALG